MNKVSLREKLDLITEHWRPKVVSELNGQEVKLVKFKGTFVWHHHDQEDELFLGVAGRFRIEFTIGGRARPRGAHRRPPGRRAPDGRRRRGFGPDLRTRGDPQHRQRRTRPVDRPDGRSRLIWLCRLCVFGDGLGCPA